VDLHAAGYDALAESSQLSDVTVDQAVNEPECIYAVVVIEMADFSEYAAGLALPVQIEMRLFAEGALGCAASA
jgi:hypothetical protein